MIHNIIISISTLSGIIPIIKLYNDNDMTTFVILTTVVSLCFLLQITNNCEYCTLLHILFLVRLSYLIGYLHKNISLLYFCLFILSNIDREKYSAVYVYLYCKFNIDINNIIMRDLI